MIRDNNNNKIAIYGLSTETERLISQWGSGPNLIGLLDGYKESGSLYGYPIISMKQAIEMGVQLIIVAARPGSCKVIAKRIKEQCIDNGILLYDVRGNDLLQEKAPRFEFSDIYIYTKADLLEAITKADVVSFDLFDTLVTRKFYDYTDVFELVKAEATIDIDISHIRIEAEKELSRTGAPRLVDIYRYATDGSAAEHLAEAEWKIDLKSLVLRDGMREILQYCKTAGKKLVLTTDTYYSKKQIKEILQMFDLDLFDKMFVSCEYGTSKTKKLFEKLSHSFPQEKILHIGDDDLADIEKAKEFGIDTFKIYSGKELFDILGGMGLENHQSVFIDRLKIGLFIAKQFSSPFQFEQENTQIRITNSHQIGYELCGPMLVDFILWLNERKKSLKLEQILLCARDGYLINEIYNRFSSDKSNIYFLTSRTAAIRAGIETDNDIAYVDGMKFFGTSNEGMLVRFGIDSEEITADDRNSVIMDAARIKRQNYLKYISGLNLSMGDLGLFDFVAKGTTQLFLQKIMPQHLKGLYFLQLEPEFMSDKNLDIQAFYTEEERETSAIFENYYLLETILTSPHPSVDEFDSEGRPVFSKETRTPESLACVKEMQDGILEYVEDYLSLSNPVNRTINKKLDEAILTLVSKLQISDESFNQMVVEDPFFGRMTKVRDVL